MDNENKYIENSQLHTYRKDGQKCPVSANGDGELKQKSAAFFAYNKQNYKNKVQLAIKNPVANSIFEFFVSEMDNTNALCISMQSLEDIFNIKRNAICKYIKYLSEKKFITIFKLGNMNVYAVNAYVVWTQGDANIYKAKFSATMYLNHDEQTQVIKSQFSKQISTK